GTDGEPGRPGGEHDRPDAGEQEEAVHGRRGRPRGLEALCPGQARAPRVERGWFRARWRGRPGLAESAWQASEIVPPDQRDRLPILDSILDDPVARRRSPES